MNRIACRYFVSAVLLLGAASLVRAEEPRTFPQLSAEAVAAIEQATPNQAPAKPQAARRVLVYSYTPAKYKYHDESISNGIKAFELMGRQTGSFTCDSSNDPSSLTADNLARYDAVIMNNAMGECYGTGDVATTRKRALLDFVRAGKGIVGIHSATAMPKPVSDQDKELLEMWGGIFAQHPWEFEPVFVRVESPEHPLSRMFDQERFIMPYPEEIFVFQDSFSRKNCRVLMSLDMTATTDKGSRPDKDYPLAWIKSFGKGRVFYSAFGHTPGCFHNGAFMKFMLAGTQFALGDLPADITPIAQPKVDLEAGFKSIFNGKDLTGWRGDKKLWGVEEGAIIGRTTKETNLQFNQFLIWTGGKPAEFDLKLQFKLIGGNSGIYFHAVERPDGEAGDPVIGPQADFSADHKWTGVVMEYLLRGKLVERGRKVRIDDKGVRKDIGSVGDPLELLKSYRENDWNDYHVIVRDNLVVLRINDVLMCELRDNDPKRRKDGLLALQVHVGPPMTVQFRNIRIKELHSPAK